MKKIFILLLFAVVILNGCSKEPEIWNSVVNKEFSNLDVWAGSGLYFYEKDNINYCTFMIYGSGVHVAGYYTSEIELTEDKIMLMELPFDYANGYLGEEIKDIQGMSHLELTYNNGIILVNDYKFEINEGIKNYKYIIEDNQL